MKSNVPNKCSYRQQKHIRLIFYPHFTTNNNASVLFLVSAEQLIPNLYSVHMDPETWEDPIVFRPERFLDDGGKVINKNLAIPFSIGRRRCAVVWTVVVNVFFGLVDCYKIINADNWLQLLVVSIEAPGNLVKICTCWLEISMIRPGLESTIFRFRDQRDADMASSYVYNFSDVCIVFVLKTTMLTMLCAHMTDNSRL